MKKILPIIVAVIVVGLAIGGIVVYQKTAKKAPVGEPQKEVEPEKKEELESFTGKLKDALTLGQAMKCTWEKDEDNFGTAYIKNENAHTDVTYEGERTHSITVGDCTYYWKEGETQGFKFCYEPEETEEPEEAEVAEEEVPEEYGMTTPDVSYNCEPAVVSDSMFEPPAEINFISPMELIGQ